MRRFVLPVNSRLIFGKAESRLGTENLHCTKIFVFKDDSELTVKETNFKKIVIPSYDMQEECVCYPSAEGNDGKTYGAKIRIPKSKDRIIVESTPDFEKCDAVEIIES